jgi:hypothetical protein
MNRVRARTTSTNPALRLVLVGLAFLLINLWVHFKQLYACDCHRAGRRLNPRRLTLLRMMHLLIRAIETDLKPLTQLQVPIHEVAPTPASGAAG